MLKGACHCGTVTWRYEGPIEGGATACNCTACRRYGALWIYGYEGEGVHLDGQTKPYVRGESLAFHFCANCGCMAAWRARELGENGKRRLAVNVRLADPEAVATIPIDHFDGLDTFEDLPRDGRCVKDYWF